VRWFDSERSSSLDLDASAIHASVDPADRAAVGRGDVPDRPRAPSSAPIAPLVRELLGPLSVHVGPGVTDVLVTPGGRIWLDDGRGLRPVDEWEPLSGDTVTDLAYALIEAGGRHLDHASPCVDARLEGGVRVHAAIPPVAVDGTSLAIRIPAARGWSLDDLVRSGAVDEDQRDVLAEHVARRSNILITGAAGTGKTTLLAALMSAAPAGERIITIEDVAELRIDHPHVVALEARQANTEGVGAIEPSRLVREALRMRPDRLVLGECRGPEIRDMLTALGTGHDGGASTLHARSLREVPARLEALGALAGLPSSSLALLASSAIDLVVHLERRDGARRVAEIGVLELRDAQLVALPHVA
jgi:pilus assembly protein CpaF